MGLSSEPAFRYTPLQMFGILSRRQKERKHLWVSRLELDLPALFKRYAPARQGIVSQLVASIWHDLALRS